MKTKSNKSQNEFGFTSNMLPKANPRTRQGRIARAKWWFNQMREIVQNQK